MSFCRRDDRGRMQNAWAGRRSPLRAPRRPQPASPRTRRSSHGSCLTSPKIAMPNEVWPPPLMKSRRPSRSITMMASRLLVRMLRENASLARSAVSTDFRAWMSSAAPYQRMMFPSGLRRGTARARNHTYGPAAMRSRYSMSRCFPVRRHLCQAFRVGSTSSGCSAVIQPRPNASSRLKSCPVQPRLGDLAELSFCIRDKHDLRVELDQAVDVSLRLGERDAQMCNLRPEPCDFRSR